MKKGKKKLNKNRSRSAGPDALGKLTRVRQKWALLGLLLLINLMAYSNSFTTGWHFDDLSNIVNNRDVHLKDFSGTSLHSAVTTKIAGTRPIAYLTFALNYYFSGPDIVPYHLVNLTIHLINAILVYALVVMLAERWHPEIARSQLRVFSLLVAALWSTSPLQTQAVTYIVQRMTSLAALFFLLSILCYIRWRSSEQPAERWGYLAGCLLCAILAFATKENAFILPAILLVYEIYCIKGFQQLRSRARFIGLLAFATLGLIVFGIHHYRVIERIQDDYTGRDFSMGERVLTEFRVVVFHLSQLLLPLPSRLSLHHEFDKSRSILVPPTTLLSLLLILGCSGAAIFWKKKWPLVSFFIVWFFLTLVIESSILPLELIFEHRLYLPSIGFFGVLLSPLLYFFRLPNTSGRTHLAVIALLAVCLSVWMTYERNKVWQDDATLWLDALEKYPSSFRVQNNLATAYAQSDRPDLAEGAFRESIRLNPKGLEAKVNLALLCLNQGRLNEAVLWAQEIDPKDVRDPYVFFNLGVIYAKQGNLAKARESYQFALNQKPDYAEACFNLGLVYLRTRDFSNARSCFDSFLKHWEGASDDRLVKDAQNYVAQLAKVK